MKGGVNEEDEITRKGTWMEQEDVQLSCFVGLFGDRRWDFVAKVSGLNRTGKSCRLRWLNYLQPGLKRCKMTPQEEKLVRDLHSIWGNRWSRIASKLPGRTDNEIKNYWRTYMRKKTQKKDSFKTTLSSLSNSCSSASNDTKVDSLPSQEIFGEESFFCDTGGSAMSTKNSEEVSMRNKDRSNNIEEEEQESMDDVWREIALWSEDSVITPANNGYCESSSPPIWKMDDKLFYDGYDLYDATTSFTS